MTLENVFYVYAIIFMTVAMVVLILLLVAIFYIRAKINEIQRRIEATAKNLDDTFSIGGSIIGSIRRIFTRREVR